MAYSGSGSGTSGNPYQITNWSELNEIRDFLGTTVTYWKLMNDLSKTTSDFYTTLFPGKTNMGNWSAGTYTTDQLVYYESNYYFVNVASTSQIPTHADWTRATGFSRIGDGSGASQRFYGHLDGDGFAIYDLYMIFSGNYNGLFGALWELASVKNIKILDFYISGGAYTGCIAGWMSMSLIEDCEFRGYIYSTSYVGGIVGYMDQNTFLAVPTIRRCSTNINVSGFQNAGGVAAYCAGSIVDVFATGSLSVTGVFAYNFGGLVGYNLGAAKNCICVMPIIQGGGAGVSGGALIGKSHAIATYENAVYDSSVSITGSNAGGFGLPTGSLKAFSTYNSPTGSMVRHWFMELDEYATRETWAIADGSTYPRIIYSGPAFNIVSTDYTGAGSGVITGAGSFVKNTVATITATPNSSLDQFYRWTGSINSFDNPINILVDANKKLIAEFRSGAIIGSGVTF